jgi:hypothetical protein
MHSGSFLYNFVLLPLVCFGGFSVMLAFVLLLPGVGNALAGLWTVLVGDWFLQGRKGQSPMIEDGESQ